MKIFLFTANNCLQSEQLVTLPLSGSIWLYIFSIPAGVSGLCSNKQAQILDQIVYCE